MITFAVDWDGTCVEDNWPKQGDWLAGAQQALVELTKLGRVIIYTCRVSPYEKHDWTMRRPTALVAEEKAYIRRMLDSIGLHQVEVWDRDFKPPADEYIDNKARRYNGRTGAWAALTKKMRLLYA